MGVDVYRGGEIRVTEPWLDLFQRNDVGKQERRAGMTEIMEAHTAQFVFLAEVWKFLRQIVGLHAVADFIHKDVAVIIIVVGVAADFFLVLLKKSRNARFEARFFPFFKKIE